MTPFKYGGIMFAFLDFSSVLTTMSIQFFLPPLLSLSQLVTLLQGPLHVATVPQDYSHLLFLYLYPTLIFDQFLRMVQQHPYNTQFLVDRVVRSTLQILISVSGFPIYIGVVLCVKAKLTVGKILEINLFALIS